MATKADFDAGEWTQLLAGPAAAGMRVMLAEKGGTVRESLGMGRAYAEARQQQGESELLDAIVAERPPVNPPEFQTEADIPGALMEQLRTAVKLLEAKADPDDLDAYRRFVIELAERVASAKKEGGVLGIGGKPVSDAERMAIDEIVNTVGGDPGGGTSLG